MAGLRGQQRLPSGTPSRLRRSQNRLADTDTAFAPGGVIATAPDGTLTLNVSGTGGLENTAGELALKLRADEGLSLNASGLGTVLDGATLERSAAGLKVTDATEAQRGSVFQQGLVADVGVIVDNSGGTDGAGTIAAVGIVITDPADTPADADTLRDDLVANTIPSIEAELSNLRNAVATLAAYASDLENKINEMLQAQQTAGQMNTI